MTQQTSDGTPATPECGKDPAPQPHGKDPNKDCTPPPYSRQPPKLEPEPEKCAGCCTCPPGPEPDGTCLDELIRKEAATASVGEEAKKSKQELEGFLAKLKSATEKYTPEKYAELVERWKENDKLLAGVIKKLVCNIPCWYCVIECEICPLLNAIARDERELNGTNQLYTTANSLYDQRYWLWREWQMRIDAFDRVNKVMTAWQDPYGTIDTALKAINTEGNAASGGKMLGPELNKLLYDVFFRLVPLHLAIAPPAADGVTTCIDKKYVELCPCDKPGERDDCCGPNVGPLSVRERLVGPQPFLIKPDAFPDLICCLAKNAYQPAKTALAAAAAAFAAMDAQIEAKKASIAARIKSLPADAKIRLGKTIECGKGFYKPKDGSSGGKCCDEGKDSGGGGAQQGTGSATPTANRNQAT